MGSRAQSAQGPAPWPTGTLDGPENKHQSEGDTEKASFRQPAVTDSAKTRQLLTCPVYVSSHKVTRSEWSGVLPAGLAIEQEKLKTSHVGSVVPQNSISQIE